MHKKLVTDLTKAVERNLLDRAFLNEVGMSKKAMVEALSAVDWRKAIGDFRFGESVAGNIKDGMYNVGKVCGDVLDVVRPAMDKLSDEPKQGWLKYVMDYCIGELFPDKPVFNSDVKYEVAMKLYLRTLRTFLRFDSEHRQFSPILDFGILEPSEYEDSSVADEYARFIRLSLKYNVYELMRIGAEITQFNTLGHIAGVHFVAMRMAFQLKKAGVPVDLALMSGAAASHDIGKFGCKEYEARRVPYLHYYYTDQCMRTNGMPLISHIASNHSTWDLELENLSVESLLLIYADFRVKSERNAEGKEVVCFYSIDDAFGVILGKLDNVDDAKRDRYSKVYAKIKDFEDYMISLGVNTDLEGEEDGVRPPRKDPALLKTSEVVDTLKYLAIEHNITLMSKFNDEAAFGSLIEAARSEKQWKSVRAYINIFDEYSTYMTQKQKQMTLAFLYDLLMHREGDIRRQAGQLIGSIIANYDEEYRKEVPEGASRREGEVTSYDLWDKYLYDTIFPEQRIAEQHRRWIGYSLKSMIQPMIDSCEKTGETKYIKALLKFYEMTNIENGPAFVLLDSMLSIPLNLCPYDSIVQLIYFADTMAGRYSEEVSISALRCAEYIAGYTCTDEPDPEICPYIDSIIEKASNGVDRNNLTVKYLDYKILKSMNRPEDRSKIDFYEKEVFFGDTTVSDIFLDNLKVDTPWVMKDVNIRLLIDRIEFGSTVDMLHTATHFSNLLKVSERITIRHSAGRGLIRIIGRLPLDQRNEIVVELTKGLEIGEYEFSKYIPEYLGAAALYLHPNELNELVGDLGKLSESSNDKMASVALDTVGEIIKRYPEYRERFEETDEVYTGRLNRMFGMLMKGLANYHEVVSQEAFLVIGQYIFGTDMLTTGHKYAAFRRISKKMLTLIADQRESELFFFNNAASLNHIYRFILDYCHKNGDFEADTKRRIAYFPGTFDPFTLSHKGIISEIRDLGFEVYLALDEFSWSKRTQARMIRRQIITMSTADEEFVYVFPDDIPVNTANIGDLDRLRALFPDDDIYMVVGSDVIENASAYTADPKPGSVHSFNHVVFRRESREERPSGMVANTDLDAAYAKISGKLVELTLPTHLEDISSSRIRESIDNNRDISKFIDPVAENFIYDNSLYLREPQYKDVMDIRSLRFERPESGSITTLESLENDIRDMGQDLDVVLDYMRRPDVRTTVLRDSRNGNRIVAVAAIGEADTVNLFEEFRNQEIAEYLRSKSTGKVAVIGGIYFARSTEVRDVVQLILTESLAECIKEGFTYAVYHPVIGGGINKRILDVLERQGFRPIPIYSPAGPVYEVDMRSPMTLTQNIVTALKEPFTENQTVLAMLESSHAKLQRAMTGLYPGHLVLSFNSNVMHRRLVEMVTKVNGVAPEPYKVRNLGPYMCVPFGKILRSIVVPNTVTKTLHTEKKYTPEITEFTVEEFPYYSPLETQIRTIKSFGRPVILVDDLLHKGYRISELDPIFKRNDVEVSKIIVGILSGRGRDLMTIQGREVDSAYFIPNLRNWFVETSLYPFIGGDNVKRPGELEASLISSINMILPYASPRFLRGASPESVYDLSMTCLTNTRDILLALEQEYQNIYERKLTLKRLGEAVVAPRVPDKGPFVTYDYNLAPSVYIENDIERLIRLKSSLVTL